MTYCCMLRTPEAWKQCFLCCGGRDEQENTPAASSGTPAHPRRWSPCRGPAGARGGERRQHKSTGLLRQQATPNRQNPRKNGVFREYFLPFSICSYFPTFRTGGLTMKSSKGSSGRTVVKFSCRIPIFFSLSQPAGLERGVGYLTLMLM